MPYTNKDYVNLLHTLSERSDEKYRAFNLSLIPGETSAYGVRIPILRELAKQIAKNDPSDYLRIAKDDTLEEIMLQGMVIGLMKCSLQERLQYVQLFVPKINNWAVCDTFCSGLKAVRTDLSTVRAFLAPYLCSNKEFDVRFAVVMLMQYYTSEPYAAGTIDALCKVRHEGYYVKMAVAWALSVCLIKYRTQVLSVIERGLLDDFTHNKTIQKCCESYRVSNEDKKYLRSLKRK